MTRYVALLRGVNVGKGNRVPMADLKSAMESLGLTHVKTLLNSGNAVFTSVARPNAKLAQAMEAMLQERLNVTTPVIVKTQTEIETIVSGSPIQPADDAHSRFLVAFGPDATALKTLAPLAALASAPEQLLITQEAAYLYCPEGILESAVGKAILGKAGKRATTRNWATVMKMRELLGGP